MKCELHDQDWSIYDILLYNARQRYFSAAFFFVSFVELRFRFKNCAVVVILCNCRPRGFKSVGADRPTPRSKDRNDPKSGLASIIQTAKLSGIVLGCIEGIQADFCMYRLILQYFQNLHNLSTLQRSRLRSCRLFHCFVDVR